MKKKREACAEQAADGVDDQAAREGAGGGGETAGAEAADASEAAAGSGEADGAGVTLALRVAYNGAPFSGFARQPGQLTVQGSLEEALALVFRREVVTVCAGRTDAGVHARGQVVSFSIAADEWRGRSADKLLRSLNALTHEDISVLSLEKCAPDFSARFNATLREYRYFISIDRATPLLMKDFSWHVGRPLNVKAMRKAAAHLVGEHDFKSFCTAASAEGASTTRTVFSIEVDHDRIWGENLIVITVEGNAFLHSMVRTIVGTLVAVGLGRRKPKWVRSVLEARQRSAAGENAPAKGLVFWRVSYKGKRVHDPRAKQAAGTAVREEDAALGRFIRGDEAGEAARGKGASDKPPAHSASRKAHAHRLRPYRDERRLPLRDPERRHPEVAVPRGDGAYVMSGSPYSDVFGSAATGAAQRFDRVGTAPGQVRVIAEGGHFGDVAWDDPMASGLDEPAIGAPQAADLTDRTSSREAAGASEGAALAADHTSVGDVCAPRSVEPSALSKQKSPVHGPESAKPAANDASERFIKRGDYPFRAKA